MPLCLFAFFLLTSCGGDRIAKLLPQFTAAEKKRVLVEYLDTKITVGDFYNELAAAATESSTFSLLTVPALREHLQNNYVQRDVVLTEMRRRGLDQAPAVLQAVQGHREVLMAIQLYAAHVKGRFTFTDEEMRACYEQHKTKYQRYPRVNVRHVQVGTEAEAARALAEIRAGEKIGEVAKERSQETFSTGQWGKTGFFPLGLDRYPMELEKELAGMQVGDIRGPIRTSKGWHIVKMIERQEGEQLTYKQAVPSIRQDLEPGKEEARLREYTDSLKAKFPVTLFPAALESLRDGADLLATVGDRKIFTDDFLAACRKMYLTTPARDLPSAKKQEVLWTVIRQQLLLLESYAQGLDRDPLVIKLLKPRQNNTLQKEFEDREIYNRVVITDSLVAANYRNKLDRIAVHYIVTKEKDLAYQVRDQLQRNTTTLDEIKTVCKQRATIRTVAWDRNETNYPPLLKAAFALSAQNKLSDVIEYVSPDDLEPNYYILIFERKVTPQLKPFAVEKERLRITLTSQARQTERDKCYARLYQDAHLRFHEDNLKFFIDRWHEYIKNMKMPAR